MLSDYDFGFLAGCSGLKAVQITGPVDNRAALWMVSGGFRIRVKQQQGLIRILFVSVRWNFDEAVVVQNAV